MEYSIRQAGTDDVELVREIEQQAAVLFRETSHAEEVEGLGLSAEFLEDRVRAGELFVAVDKNDIPVGFAAIHDLAGYVHLHELSVKPAHGKRGLGAGLVEAVCCHAKEKGYIGVTLSTYADVPWNAPFYRRLGFDTVYPDEMSTEMKDLRDLESEQGIDVEHRVIMIRHL